MPPRPALLGSLGMSSSAYFGDLRSAFQLNLRSGGYRCEPLVNAVAPGPVWTPLQPSGGQPPEKLPEFGANVPEKRPGQPAELAPLYVALASNELSFTTDQVFGATGGKVGP